MTERPRFEGGSNVAIKLPKHVYDKTVAFYRDTLGLPVVEAGETVTAFQFGPIKLWLDRMESYSQTDVWFEIRANDTAAAKKYLSERGVPRRDEVEKLPPDLDGFWISSPAGTIHLVCHE